MLAYKWKKESMSLVSWFAYKSQNCDTISPTSEIRDSTQTKAMSWEVLKTLPHSSTQIIFEHDKVLYK